MSLPTPAEDALRVYLRRVMDPDDSVEAERMLDAAIRADRLRVLDIVERFVMVDGCSIYARKRLESLRREIEQP